MSETGDVASHDAWLASVLARCRFPGPGRSVHCAFSGGGDSTALIVLAQAAGLDVTAHHVDHRIRSESSIDAERAAEIADRVGVRFTAHVVEVAPGPNLEARARSARFGVLPSGVLTGHTADDQAETVLLRLLRGSGSRGLSAIEPGPSHPLLAIRRSETATVCAAAGIEPLHDHTNDLPDAWRNRIRAEVLPLLADIADRDLVPIITRSADLLRGDADLLDRLADELDPTDARALASAPTALASRAVRRWLAVDGYPPDVAAIERVLSVAQGEAVACELPGGRRIERSHQRLRIVGDISIS